MNVTAQEFEELVERHKGIFFKVAHMYCHNTADRDDLLQEMMIHVWHSLPRYNHDKQCKISTWLYRVALNVAISFYRKHGSRAQRYIALDEAPDEALSASTEQSTELRSMGKSEHEQQLQLLEQCISELKELDRALMVLYLEDKSHAEIADIMGLSVSNVGTKIGRIKDKLKQRFSHHQSL
jgi:RNA polymerase sigma-70 factor (ECF subfamily)